MKAIYENHYLTDNDVANFARHSFSDLAKNFSEADNHGLIRFLARGMKSQDWSELIDRMCNIDDPIEAEAMANYLRKIPEHWVPFGHPQISLRMSAPVPIRTQCFKHKIGYVESEESRRYIKSEPEFYFPEFFRKAADDVKQGSSEEPMIAAAGWMIEYRYHCEHSKNLYIAAIEEGMCPEQARFFLPQGTKVNWVWTGSLYAFTNMYNQRSDSHAQKEIQALAQQVCEIIAPLYPVSWEALTK